MRAGPATADIPIIAITSFALSGDKQRAKEAGASAYLAKPYSPFTLLDMIRKLLIQLQAPERMRIKDAFAARHQGMSPAPRD